MAFLDTDGATIHYDTIEQGHRPWVSLIPGHMRSLDDYRVLSKKLSEFGFNVLSIDNRGAGKTTITKPFSIEDMANDLLSVWGHKGIEQSHLFGISMGGMLAQKITLTQPEMVLKLILVSTASASRNIVSSGEWGTSIEENTKKLAPYFTQSFYQRNKFLIDQMIKQINKQINEGNFLNHSQLQRSAIASFDVERDLQEIKNESLIIHGELDAIIPHENAVALSRKIPNCRLVSIEEVGHLILAEKPQALYSEMKSFLT